MSGGCRHLQAAEERGKKGLRGRGEDLEVAVTGRFRKEKVRGR
jgi:hypothetical protein